MCGIAGFISPGQRLDKDVLNRMVQAIGHRGPDEAQTVQIGSIGLGHSRLSILDRSPAGRQPMGYRTGNWWLAYNGEIYNHAELRDQLPPYDYRGHSDSETLLHLLATWGPQAIHRCNGIFAFAALDVDGRKLYLARDRFGVKPLYVSVQEGGFWFASEIQSILAAGLPRRAREDVMRHSLIHRWTNGRDTHVEAIDRAMPGTFLTVDIDTLQMKETSWWDPADSVDPDLAARLSQLSREEAVRAVDQALESAVRKRLLSDVPIGTLCSGGLDSSLITAYARETAPDILAYNAAIPDQPDVDESCWAQEVCRHLNVRLHSVPVDRQTWRSMFVRAVKHYEYPLVHESSVALALIAQQANLDGVRVLLSGEASDELFGGYESRHGPERIRFGAAMGQPLPNNSPPAGSTTSPNDPMHSLFSSPVLQRVGDYENGARNSLLAAYAHHEGARGQLEAAIGSDLRNFLSHGFNRLDKNMMQYAVEIREPFCDPAVVSLAMNMPIELRIHPRLKGVLLDVARRRLPERIVSRPKAGFSFDLTPYFAGATRTDALRDGRLRELLAIDRNRWCAAVSSLSGRSLFRLWSAEAWCRLMLDGESIQSVEAAIWRA